ncbi:hypothetical protein LCGC14_2702100 [marine sediment metagenome]|uniref:Uncharacterized protein n=1 Tax=marine sediment metagenome TaxID=412755 RepID=A0A0F8ZFD6_9ZZZZ
MKDYTTPGWYAVGVLALIAILYAPIPVVVAGLAVAVIIHAWYGSW